jgi:hypothetical protein
LGNAIGPDLSLSITATQEVLQFWRGGLLFDISSSGGTDFATSLYSLESLTSQVFESVFEHNSVCSCGSLSRNAYQFLVVQLKLHGSLARLLAVVSPLCLIHLKTPRLKKLLIAFVLLTVFLPILRLGIVPRVFPKVTCVIQQAGGTPVKAWGEAACLNNGQDSIVFRAK